MVLGGWATGGVSWTPGQGLVAQQDTEGSHDSPDGQLRWGVSHSCTVLMAQDSLRGFARWFFASVASRRFGVSFDPRVLKDFR